jgi:predicted unusual protein kinase regulating ubiquinone biosynthesis (AarF/ABC1/UbiB family)
MEYLDGIKLNNIPSDHYEDFAKQVVKFGFVTTYYHGFTHADLHAGNILFIKEDNYYKLGILDFGMMLTIDNDYKFKLFELLYDIFEEDVNIVAKNILHSNVIIQPVEVIESLPKEHYDYLIEFIVKLLNDTIHNKENTTQYRIYEFISKFHEYINKYSIFSFGLYLNDNFIKTQLILIMYHGIFMKLCKENWLEIFNKTINELFHMELLNELRSNKLMIVSKKEE